MGKLSDYSPVTLKTSSLSNPLMMLGLCYVAVVGRDVEGNIWNKDGS